MLSLLDGGLGKNKARFRKKLFISWLQHSEQNCHEIRLNFTNYSCSHAYTTTPHFKSFKLTKFNELKVVHEWQLEGNTHSTPVNEVIQDLGNQLIQHSVCTTNVMSWLCLIPSWTQYMYRTRVQIGLWSIFTSVLQIFIVVVFVIHTMNCNVTLSEVI